MGLKNIIKGLLGKGIRIGYSTGRPFDPSTQERTDALEDIAKAKERKAKNGTISKGV